MARSKRAKVQILDDGTLMLFGVIGDEFDGLDSATVVQEIRSLGDVEDIHVLINSPGGFVDQGLAIYHELLTHPANITVEITGVAASMASAIAMAGDNVAIAENGMIMVHDPWAVEAGTAEELRKAAEMLDKFGDSLVGIYDRKTGLGEDRVRELMNKETWLNAEEALELGFVDEIIQAVEAAAFADIDTSQLTHVPEKLVALIRQGRKAAAAARAAEGDDEIPEVPAHEVENEIETQSGARTTDGDKEMPETKQADQNTVTEAVAAERARISAIRTFADRMGDRIPQSLVTEHVDKGSTETEFRAAVAEHLAEQDEKRNPRPGPSGVGVVTDEADKFVEGASAWLIQKSGRASLFPDEKLDPGEFRGMSLLDLARATIERGGRSTRGMSKMEIAGEALARPRAEAGLGTRSDFPVLLENVLHKMLLAAYGTIPDTWRLFCAEGTVSDFRPHPRLRLGSFGRLDTLLDSGEFKAKHFPDAEKETLSAATVGNIVGLTRQAIVNDDVDGFSRLITMLGRAAALSVEVDVYALLAQNGGLGPAMGDGNPLFDASHNNIGTGSALSVAGIDGDRVVMAEQTDPSGNEFLDLRPAVLVLPIGLGGQARVINEAQFDVDAVNAGTDEQNKFMQPNKVVGLFRDIVDTPRISGTRRYLFADPAIAPTIEVAFLDGQSAPVLETEDGFDYDGVRWRVRYDYGVGATDFRGAVTNAGA